MFDKILRQGRFELVGDRWILLLPEQYMNLSTSLQFLIEAYAYANNETDRAHGICCLSMDEWTHLLTESNIVSVTQGVG